MSAPTLAPTLRRTSFGIYVHQPIRDPEHPANRGPVLAYARRRVEDRLWEVRDMRIGRLAGTFRTEQAARDRLVELTGATP